MCERESRQTIRTQNLFCVSTLPIRVRQVPPFLHVNVVSFSYYQKATSVILTPKARSSIKRMIRISLNTFALF